MKVTFENSKSDYSNYFRWLFFYNKLGGRLMVIVILSLWFGAGSSQQAGWPDTVTLVLRSFWFFLVFAASLVLFYFITILRFNKHAKKLDFPIQITAELFSEGIHIEGKKTTFFKWAEIKKIRNSPLAIIIQLRSGLVIIPKEYFDDIKHQQDFYYKLSGGYGQSRYLNPKPNYMLGFLGLIPLIGGINGIVMVIQGISKYKDIRYIMIGIAGILFTISIYGFLFYESSFGTLFNDSELQMTKGELNDLVKKIEFYKLQNGHYPDSLRQIDDDHMTFMYETMHHSFGSKKAVLFNYKRLGNKYTIFSSGFDGIPHTRDDVYPSIDVSDTSKFGFVKRP